MDRLDKITILAAVICLLVALGMLGQEEVLIRATQDAAAAASKEKEAYAVDIALNKQIYQEVTAALEQGNFNEATAAMEGVIAKYPGRSFSHVVLARLALKQGSLSDAIDNYRKAVEMEPDYIDKKTPLFIGKEIKTVVKEGLEKFSREKKLRPGDKAVKQSLHDVYYLQRRLLGGCE